MHFLPEELSRSVELLDVRVEMFARAFVAVRDEEVTGLGVRCERDFAQRVDRARCTRGATMHRAADGAQSAERGLRRDGTERQHSQRAQERRDHPHV